MYKWTSLWVLPFVFLFCSSSQGEIIWNGFASVYGRQTLTKNPADISADNRGKGFNFSNDTKIGLNLRSNFAENWAAVGQLVASRRALTPVNAGPQWGPQFDWFFVTYDDPTTELSIKIGRQLFPGTLTAEYIDVGLTYPWRELPQQYKSALSFKSFEGLSVSRQFDLASSHMVIRAFGGNDDSSEPTRSQGGYYGYEVNDLFGLQATLEGDGWKLQAVYSAFKLSTTVMMTPTTPGALPTLAIVEREGVDETFMVGGRYDRDAIMGYLEYMQSCNSFLGICAAKSYYGTLGYHLGKFLPHYTYAFADWNVTGFITGKEISHGFGLNYQVDSSVVLKAEYLIQEDRDGVVFLTGLGQAESVAVGINVVF